MLTMNLALLPQDHVLRRDDHAALAGQGLRGPPHALPRELRGGARRRLPRRRDQGGFAREHEEPEAGEERPAQDGLRLILGIFS